MTPGQTDHAATLLTAAALYSNSPPDAWKNCREVNPNVNHYNNNPMEISSTFWLPDLTDRWHQQDEMHWMYADLSKVACNKFSIIPHGVGVEASFSNGRDVIGWRQSKTTSEMLWEEVITWQFARANNRILADNCTALETGETEDDLEFKNEKEERKLHRMANVRCLLEIWQGSQILRDTQKEFRPQHKQLTAVVDISDTEETIKASCISKNHFRPGGMAPSEWTRSVRAVRATPVAGYSAPSAKTTRRVAYRPRIAVSPFLLALSVS